MLTRHGNNFTNEWYLLGEDGARLENGGTWHTNGPDGDIYELGDITFEENYGVLLGKIVSRNGAGDWTCETCVFLKEN